MQTELQVVENKASEALNQAQALVVSDREQYSAAGVFTRGLKSIEKAICETFDPIVTKALAAHREAVAQRKKHLEPIEQAERVVKSKMLSFAEAEARQQAEERRVAEEAARKAQEEAKLAQAIAAEQKGQLKQAEAILERPVAPVFIPEQPKAKAEGIGIRTTYSAEVTDLLELCKAVVADPSKLNLILPNQVALNKLATALGNNMRVPGVSVVEKKGISARV